MSVISCCNYENVGRCTKFSHVGCKYQCEFLCTCEEEEEENDVCNCKFIKRKFIVVIDERSAKGSCIITYESVNVSVKYFETHTHDMMNDHSNFIKPQSITISTGYSLDYDIDSIQDFLQLLMYFINRCKDFNVIFEVFRKLKVLTDSDISEYKKKFYTILYAFFTSKQTKTNSKIVGSIVEAFISFIIISKINTLHVKHEKKECVHYK